MKDKNALLTICSEFETFAAIAPRHTAAHVKLIMKQVFDLSGIQKLYTGGAMNESDCIAMIERHCKHARDELRKAIAPNKAKKKVLAPIPAEFDKPIPAQDIQKLNQSTYGFAKMAARSLEQLAIMVASKLSDEELLEICLQVGDHELFGTALKREYERKHPEDFDGGPPTIDEHGGDWKDDPTGEEDKRVAKARWFKALSDRNLKSDR